MKRSVMMFFNTLQKQFTQTKFTKELKHQSQVNYWDVLLTRNNDFKFLVVYVMYVGIAIDVNEFSMSQKTLKVCEIRH